MRNSFLANLKKYSTGSANSSDDQQYTSAIGLSAVKHQVEELKPEEYSAVAGGPQVRNDPEG